MIQLDFFPCIKYEFFEEACPRPALAYPEHAPNIDWQRMMDPNNTTNPRNVLPHVHGAGAAEQPSGKYYKAAALADALARDVHYTVDEKQKAVLITDEGYEAAEDVLEVGLRFSFCALAKESVVRSNMCLIWGFERTLHDRCYIATSPGIPTLHFRDLKLTYQCIYACMFGTHY